MTTIRDEELMRRFMAEFSELLEEVRKLRLEVKKLRIQESADSGDWYFNH